MGFFDFLFCRKGSPIGVDTVVKRMSASRRDFKGVALDDEDHPIDVYECGDVAVTEMGRTLVRRLYPCRDKVGAACVRLRKKQAEMFYVKTLPFRLEFAWKNGGRVKMTARFDRQSGALCEWLRTNVTESGRNLTAKDVAALLDGKFASDAPPEWLVADGREDVAEPEPPAEPEEPTAADLKPGAVVFDHYRIEKELGKGGQGQVFLATDTQTVVTAHSRVVLKVLRCDSAGDEASLAEFIREANTLSDMRDDRIVACYWCKLLGKTPILAMEYVEGISLDKYLAEHKDGKIGEEEARELLRPIAEALDYAHGKGIYHRDVKPQNIVVRKEPKRIGGKLIRTCLLDFGIAGSGQRGDGQTDFWSVRGTFQYMSPEQKMVGHKPCASMDVYSLAVTAYECVMGEMPYPGGWERDAKPAPIQSNTPFACSVMRGLEMLPEKRPATCCELIDPRPSYGGSAATSSAASTSPSSDGRARSPSVPPAPNDLKQLERSFMVYRQMLAQSAAKCETANSVLAGWLRDRQAALRDLTADLSRVDPAALVQFFEGMKEHAIAAHMKAEDIFLATDRLVELRSSLPNGDDAVLQALRESIC